MTVKVYNMIYWIKSIGYCFIVVPDGFSAGIEKTKSDIVPARNDKCPRNHTSEHPRLELVVGLLLSVVEFLRVQPNSAQLLFVYRTKMGRSF
jgi:hypothetical protein